MSAAVSDAVEAAMAAADACNWAQDMSALRLAHDLADVLDAPLNDVWWSLCNVPANMAGLLDSPQGWSALAGVVAFDLGAPATSYAPLVH